MICDLTGLAPADSRRLKQLCENNRAGPAEVEITKLPIL
jgi:hypothetical protein